MIVSILDALHELFFQLGNFEGSLFEFFVIFLFAERASFPTELAQFRGGPSRLVSRATRR